MKSFVLAATLAVCPAFARADVALSIVSHRWQEVITESNHASLRPGSVYDINTYFEQNFGVARPKFNYLFRDTGLGATDPIYSIFQSGYQYSWGQLIAAGWSQNVRHIDHFSESETLEGCLIKSSYWVRHIDEFPDMYHKLRAEGYTLVDISFDHYIKLRPDAQCGKHKAHDPDPSFDPFKEIYKYADKFRTLDDIPPELLAKYEAKIGILKLVTEEFSRSKWPRYEQQFSLKANSLYFYPDAFAPDYGIGTPRALEGLATLNKPMQFVLPATAELQRRLPLSSVVKGDDWTKTWNFLNGKPTPDFDLAFEPGEDGFSLEQVTPKFMYTAGTKMFPIEDVRADVRRDNLRLVSAVVRPAEPEVDVHFPGLRKIPQVRLVYQLMNPRHPDEALEQLYFHVIYDAVDRLAADDVRAAQAADFLKRFDELARVRETGGTLEADAATARFLEDFTATRAPEAISFSSSLTGIWVFGQLARSYNEARELKAVPIVREGVNVGYYSSVYDTVLFRAAAKAATGERKAALEKILDDLTPRFYRDPRRHDPEALTFQRVTCAQCHQVAGRDGVHMAFNDGIDRRIKTPWRATEILFRELDLQLRNVPGTFSGKVPGT